MKTRSTQLDSAPKLVALVAANDGSVASSGFGKVAATAAWDPYEVWRTRILPYQQQLRAAAERVQSGDTDRS